MEIVFLLGVTVIEFRNYFEYTMSFIDECKYIILIVKIKF